jgi:hypothetical protein
MKRMTEKRLAEFAGIHLDSAGYGPELLQALKAERIWAEVGEDFAKEWGEHFPDDGPKEVASRIRALQKKVCLHTEITFNAENCVYMCDQCDERVYPSPPFVEAGIVYTTHPDAL